MRRGVVDSAGWHRCRSTGFTLLEMAIVLLLIGLLLGGGISLLSAQIAIQHIEATRQNMDEVMLALRGHAAFAGGRLPCPDSEAPFDGREDVDAISGQCQSDLSEGWLPYVSLGGVGRTDAWGHRFRYRVVPEVARFHMENFPPPSLRICRSLNASSQCLLMEASAVLAVVVSHGANGHGANDAQGGTLPVPTGAVDELANSDGDENFVSHEPRLPAGQGGEYDDLLVWLPNSSYQALMLGR